MWTRLDKARHHDKLHWAMRGQTAAEVIVDRADATKEHLHTWTDAPHGKIQISTWSLTLVARAG
jgi:hypothetical protein